MSPPAFAIRYLFVAAFSSLLGEPPSPEKPVKVCVVSILATESNDKVDDNLKRIAEQVKKLRPKLTGFRMAKITCKSVPVGAKESFELADDQKADIVIDRWTDEK